MKVKHFYNKKTKDAIVNTPTSSTNNTATNTENANTTNTTSNSPLLKNLTIIEYEGVKYLSVSEIQAVCFSNKIDISFRGGDNTKTSFALSEKFSNVLIDFKWGIKIGQKNGVYIKYDDYVNTVIPYINSHK